MCGVVSLDNNLQKTKWHDIMKMVFHIDFDTSSDIPSSADKRQVVLGLLGIGGDPRTFRL